MDNFTITSGWPQAWSEAAIDQKSVVFGITPTGAGTATETIAMTGPGDRPDVAPLNGSFVIARK
jgi:hypothetical protein